LLLKIKAYFLLKSVFAQGLNKSYINFYNIQLKIKAEDFYVPCVMNAREKCVDIEATLKA